MVLSSLSLRLYEAPRLDAEGAPRARGLSRLGEARLGLARLARASGLLRPFAGFCGEEVESLIAKTDGDVV